MQSSHCCSLWPSVNICVISRLPDAPALEGWTREGEGRPQHQGQPQPHRLHRLRAQLQPGQGGQHHRTDIQTDGRPAGIWRERDSYKVAGEERRTADVGCILITISVFSWQQILDFPGPSVPAVRGGGPVRCSPGVCPQEGKVGVWAHEDPPAEPEVLHELRSSPCPLSQLGPGGPQVSLSSCSSRYVEPAIYLASDCWPNINTLSCQTIHFELLTIDWCPQLSVFSQV